MRPSALRRPIATSHSRATFSIDHRIGPQQLRKLGLASGRCSERFMVDRRKPAGRQADDALRGARQEKVMQVGQNHREDKER